MTNGMKTSEFLITVAIIALGSFMASGLVGDGSTPMRIAGAAMATLKGISYTMSRAKVKAAESTGPEAPATQVAGGNIENVTPPPPPATGGVS
jgi:hypothetical protein